jgi:hypothetical protein
MNLLRLSLRVDAVVSGVFGALLVLGGPVLVDVLGAPLGVLWAVGAVALLYAAWLWFAVPASQAWLVVGLNLVWAALSVLLVLLGWLPLSVFGTVFVLLQALVVAGLAEMQFVGYRAARQ